MSEMFDAWVIVEGAAGNAGSTNWCGSPVEGYHNNGHSVDGTLEYIRSMERSADNVYTITKGGCWQSKDEMVNSATDFIRREIREEPMYLWEVDVDEQWTLPDLRAAEKHLDAAGAKTGMFLANYFVGPNLIVKGEWGEGLLLPYNRLWNWNGQDFQKHEPPILEGGNEPSILLPQRFNHYAYAFEQDVRFKDLWYGGHRGILDKWKRLQELPAEAFPQDISALTPFSWGGGKTTIHHI